MNDQFRQRLTYRLAGLHNQDLHRTTRVVESSPDGRCRINGQSLINFGGNDYLSLAHEVGSSEAVQQAWKQQVGATASAVLSGRSRWHEQLEIKLAEFEDTESALLFPTGFAANVGVLNSLVESNDAIFCDRDNHASIVDAARSSKGQFCVFRKDRLDSLEDSIMRRRDRFEQIFIVTDGVFSMDGSIAALGDLCQIAGRNECHVIVDEAHGTGVLGDYGRGACDFSNVEDRVLLRVGTMSKALGGLGGFVVSDNQTIDWLRNTARTQFFSTALPPGICAAMLESIRIVQEEPQRRHRLAAITALAHREIRRLGLKTVAGGVAPIIPIVIGDSSRAVAISKQLQREGWFVPAIRPPTVAKGTARLRLSLCSSHTNQQVEDVIAAVSNLQSIE